MISIRVVIVSSRLLVISYSSVGISIIVMMFRWNRLCVFMNRNRLVRLKWVCLVKVF